MPGVRVTLNPPVSFIVRQTGAFRAALEDLTELWERIKPVMSEIEEERWATEGYGGWPGGPNYHGMVRTGDLKGSLVDPGSAVLSEGPTELVWGTNVFYAGFHQGGEGNNPVRKVLDLEEGGGRQKIEQATVAWLNDLVARHWAW